MKRDHHDQRERDRSTVSPNLLTAKETSAVFCANVSPSTAPPALQGAWLRPRQRFGLGAGRLNRRRSGIALAWKPDPWARWRRFCQRAGGGAGQQSARRPLRWRRFRSCWTVTAPRRPGLASDRGRCRLGWPAPGRQVGAEVLHAATRASRRAGRRRPAAVLGEVREVAITHQPIARRAAPACCPARRRGERRRPGVGERLGRA